MTPANEPNKPTFISYRQGGERYADIVMPNSANKLILNFDDNISISATAIWDQLKPDVHFDYINFANIFNNSNSNNLEIGIGNGEFITAKATECSDENFIGLEVYKEVFIKATKRIKKANIINCKIIQFDAALILRLIPDNFLNNIYINFPDPWPKKSHKKRRLLKPYFLDQLATKLKSGGLLHIATDHEDYALEIMDNISQVESKNFKSTFDTVSVRELDGYLPTKYYRKFVLNNKPYFFRYVKI